MAYTITHTLTDHPYYTFLIYAWMINPLGYKILMEILDVGQDTIVSSTSLPILREILLDNTKLILEIFKLHMR
jgi:hypothetical protein